MVIWPIHESNDCHEPAGSPSGGQFCSKGVPAKVYHHTFAEHRAGITARGLSLDRSQTGGIHFTTDPTPTRESDEVWEVDTSKLHGIEPDPDREVVDIPESENWFVVYQDVPTHALRLVRRGKK